MSQPFFSHLSRLRYSQRSYGANALVFERDDPVKSVFAVKSGEVHLLRRQPDGAKFILQRTGSGSLLAEASITTQSYHCSAVAMIPSVLLIYSRRDVQAMIADDPASAAALTAHLAQEVREVRLRAEIVSLRKVADRLDAWLAWHDDHLPDKGNWHRIATEIGVSQEALYRELARRR